MGRNEVWRWSRITWSCPGGMEDRKVMAVIEERHEGEW